jgi:NADH-quinone oxidoreductase subunit G
VLRVLANLLDLPGFNQETADEVRDEALGDSATLGRRLDNSSPAAIAMPALPAGLQRIADVPIYATDSLVRRAPALQQTADAREPRVGLSAALWRHLGLQPGDRVRVEQGGDSAVLVARMDASLASAAVRVAAGHPSTAALGAMFGPVTVEKA